MSIGLIAGGGQLPRMISNACHNHNQELFIAGIQGSGVDETLSNLKIFPIAKVGAIIRYFKDNSVTQLSICGSLKRPNFKTLIPDAKGLAVLSKIIFKSLGDDALLKIIRRELESEGFKIIAVQDLIPELLAPHGSLSIIKPNETDMDTIRLGWDAARYHGAQDLGQSIVVQNDTVLGLEDEKGTDELLKKCAAIKQQDGCKPILVKLSKPQQDMALDAPTIGANTIENLASLGYGGLVIEAGRTLIVNRAEVINTCMQHGLFLESYTDEDIHHRG
jgi:DUF1009 family protein